MGEYRKIDDKVIDWGPGTFVLGYGEDVSATNGVDAAIALSAISVEYEEPTTVAALQTYFCDGPGDPILGLAVAELTAEDCVILGAELMEMAGGIVEVETKYAADQGVCPDGHTCFLRDDVDDGIDRITPLSYRRECGCGYVGMPLMDTTYTTNAREAR